MDNASKNAEEMITKLQVSLTFCRNLRPFTDPLRQQMTFNRMRQAEITNQRACFLLSLMIGD